MVDSVCGATGVHVQRYQVFHAQVQQLRIFERRYPHLSQLESHQQDSSDVPIKGGQGTDPPRPKSGIQIIAHINAEVGWRPIMLKPHSVTNGYRIILQEFW
ncbi:hypothetical protein AVEN_84581-1 [Araneus ventricosus]|uniref:Uncharacterized protein n=1 Tax=Araneus ventricosus TaxID=182803 RepID=A0A4Y2C2T9_ARAVE|nr:hypothetical protein AVEN_84581-1 [Araneus ventricosus]